jgi:hypothetical protein
MMGERFSAKKRCLAPSLGLAGAKIGCLAPKIAGNWVPGTNVWVFGECAWFASYLIC